MSPTYYLEIGNIGSEITQKLKRLDWCENLVYQSLWNSSLEYVGIPPKSKIKNRWFY